MLPREITAEHWPERQTYDLPVRPIGRVRYIGLLLMAFAAAFASVPGGHVLRLLRRSLAGEAVPADWIFGVFTLVFVAAALVPFALGMFILCGRTRLVLTRDRLKVTEIAGPFRWSRRFRLVDIERLQLGAAAGQQPAGGAAPAGLARLTAVGAVLRNNKKALLLIGYPRDWLAPLTEELSGAIRLEGTPVTVEQVGPMRTVGVVRNEEVQQQPATSNAQVAETGTGVELKLPSKGFWRESGGLLLFSLAWCGFMVVFTGAIIGGALKHHTQLHTALGILAFLLVFWLVGVGLLLLSIHLGTRRWVVRADARHLEATLRSAVRFRTWHWEAAELSELKVAYSNVEVNNRRLEELQVQPRAGKKTALLRGRDHDELAWVATTLRRVLKMTPPNDTATPGQD